MLTKLKLLSYIVVLAGLITACEDGDPGPTGNKGEQGDTGNAGQATESSYKRIGYFEGTVSGTKKDGTAFSEPFKYQYTNDSTEAFVDAQRSQTIQFERFGGYNQATYFRLGLVSPLEGIFEPNQTENLNAFAFVKEIDKHTLFRILARPGFKSTEAYVREISLEKNENYQFQHSGMHGHLSFYETTYNGSPAYHVTAYRHYSFFSLYYSVDTGALIAIYEYNNGGYLTSGEVFDLYNTLTFKTHPTLGIPVFYDAANDSPLHEEIPAVPADQLTITNYSHDTSTGVITFDFEMKISGILSDAGRLNNTGHDLTIKGKFNSGRKVYKNTIF